MDLTPDEISWLKFTRALAYDEQGRPIRVGLTYEETVEFYTLRKQTLMGRTGFQGTGAEYGAKCERLHELERKHEHKPQTMFIHDETPKH